MADALIAWCRGEQPPLVVELMGIDQARIGVLDLMAARDRLPELLVQAFASWKREK
ncbi:MAG: hypothetical protein IPN92_16140 [Chromatiaceae bacterium]|nr:hypothetical protein [Chromatiaceae bacterium]